MSWLTQLEINQRDSEMRDDIIPTGCPDGYCVCCQSNEGLNEDGIPCGYCDKGIELNKEE